MQDKDQFDPYDFGDLDKREKVEYVLFLNQNADNAKIAILRNNFEDDLTLIDHTIASVGVTPGVLDTTQEDMKRQIEEQGLVPADEYVDSGQVADEDDAPKKKKH